MMCATHPFADRTVTVAVVPHAPPGRGLEPRAVVPTCPRRLAAPPPKRQPKWQRANGPELISRSFGTLLDIGQAQWCDTTIDQQYGLTCLAGGPALERSRQALRGVAMSGGYIQCGDFMGSDKSGSAISGLMDAVPEFVPPADRQSFVETIIAPINKALANCKEYILIEPNIAARLIPALESFNARIGQELGFPEPWEAPDKDEQAGLDPTEAKWGKGKGWQLYSPHDLLQACRVSAKAREPICVSFD